MGTNQNPWPAREMKTNQKPTPNPSTEGNQLDVSQPRNFRFSNFSCKNTLYKQCNPEFGVPPYSRCVGICGSPSSSLVIKTLLLLHRTLRGTAREGLSLGSRSALCRDLGTSLSSLSRPPEEFTTLKAPGRLGLATFHRR